MREKLDPLCMKGEMAFSVTNRGELIPCCRCDEPKTINDPEFQKLLAASKISEHDSIDDILKTKQWKRFYKNLLKHKGPAACWRTCRADKSEKEKQTFSVIDPNTNEIKQRQKR